MRDFGWAGRMIYFSHKESGEMKVNLILSLKNLNAHIPLRMFWRMDL